MFRLCFAPKCFGFFVLFTLLMFSLSCLQQPLLLFLKVLIYAFIAYLCSLDVWFCLFLVDHNRLAAALEISRYLLCCSSITIKLFTRSPCCCGLFACFGFFIFFILPLCDRCTQVILSSDFPFCIHSLTSASSFVFPVMFFVCTLFMFSCLCSPQPLVLLHIVPTLLIYAV